METAFSRGMIVVGWFASREIGGERLKDRRQARHVRQCVMEEEDPRGDDMGLYDWIEGIFDRPVVEFDGL